MPSIVTMHMDGSMLILAFGDETSGRIRFESSS